VTTFSGQGCTPPVFACCAAACFSAARKLAAGVIVGAL
jgi:hypothetical protein